MRAAGAHERYRGAGDGQEPQVDARMYRDMRCKKNEHAEREERIEIGGGGTRNLNETREQKSVHEE